MLTGQSRWTNIWLTEKRAGKASLKVVERGDELLREPEKFPEDKRTWRERGSWMLRVLR